MLILKQSTTINVKIGPFLDATDGVTAETALTVAAELSKNGGTFAARNSATATAHDAEGWYTVELDATDTGTLGRLQLKSVDAAALPVWHEYMVVPANVWDSLFGADKLQVHADEITAGLINSTAAPNLDAAVSSRLATANITLSAGAVTVGTNNDKTGYAIGTGGIAAAAFAANAIDAAAISADAIDEIWDEILVELAQGAPPITPKGREALMLIYMALRNDSASTATERRIKNDAGTVIAKGTMSDDGTTFVQGKLVTGP